MNVVICSEALCVCRCLNLRPPGLQISARPSEILQGKRRYWKTVWYRCRINLRRPLFTRCDYIETMAITYCTSLCVWRSLVTWYSSTCMVVLCACRSLDCDRNTIHKHLVFSLMIAQIVLVTGIQQTNPQVRCSFLFLHGWKQPKAL
jgi:hypothetical protein